VSLKYTAQEIAEFLVEAKLAKKVPDLSQIFDDRFVKAYAAKQK
jgi:NitT/TauT family transport system substrate-binding protein